MEAPGLEHGQVHRTPQSGDADVAAVSGGGGVLAGQALGAGVVALAGDEADAPLVGLHTVAALAADVFHAQGNLAQTEAAAC